MLDLSTSKSLNLSIYLSIYLSIHPSIYLSIHPSIYLSIHPSIHPSIYHNHHHPIEGTWPSTQYILLSSPRSPNHPSKLHAECVLMRELMVSCRLQLGLPNGPKVPWRFFDFSSEKEALQFFNIFSIQLVAVLRWDLGWRVNKFPNQTWSAYDSLCARMCFGATPSKR